MRWVTVVIGVCFSAQLCLATIINVPDDQPLAFTENMGQWDDQVKFKTIAGGATIWFTKEGIYHQFIRRASDDGLSPEERLNMPNDRTDLQHGSIEQLVIKSSFVGANPNPKIVGEGLMEYKCNYFIGNDPEKWYTDVPNYKAMVFKDVYAGIDLKYYGNGKQMEYDFIVSPGADPSQIMVQYDGAKSISVNDAGELVVETDWGNVTELRPLMYQFDANGCMPIEGEYVLFTDNTFGFGLGGRYDPALSLVIDPTLEYSTYLGGDSDDAGSGIAVDVSGNAYVTGYTYSTDFPTEDPYQMDQGDIDVFVTKLTSNGNSLVYSTYLGGSDSEQGWGIAVDGSGNAYVTGHTESSDFPTENPYQETFQGGGFDVFVTKLSSSGNSLVYSTYLGGSGGDLGRGIAVDGSGAAYVAGYTHSADFPTVDPYQTEHGGGYYDAFVTKLNSIGNGLIYSTFLGGSDSEQGRGIAVDVSGNAYVTGYTYSTDFPTQNPYQAENEGGEHDAYVTKLNSIGNGLIYSTYLGGYSGEIGYAIAVDGSGAAYVTGSTSSTDFPTLNPYQTDTDGEVSDVFVTKLSGSGSSLVYSTYLGGYGVDIGYGIAVDDSGAAYVTGHTESTDFPTLNPYQTDQGDRDVFVTELSSSGNSLVYSTYLGGSDREWGYDIAVDDSGAAYVTGMTYSTDFPTENPYQAGLAGGLDAFATLIEECDDQDTDWVCDYEDNCLDVYNPLQEDVDEDGFGDSCDVCPYHALDDCCNPVGMNELPTITSGASETTAPGHDFVYLATATDPNCDGSELVFTFEDYPIWMSANGNQLSGVVECYHENTTFTVIASDGDLADTLGVSLIIDKSNQSPEIADSVEEFRVRVDEIFIFYPTILDPDDSIHTVSYPVIPNWCTVQNDSVIGVAPDVLFYELLKTVVQDYCNADTAQFFVRVYPCGDADMSGDVDIDDVVFLIQYIFAGGLAPDPLMAGDADCSGDIDIDDVVYLIAYIFSGGPEPCSDCP